VLTFVFKTTITEIHARNPIVNGHAWNHCYNHTAPEIHGLLMLWRLHTNSLKRFITYAVKTASLSNHGLSDNDLSHRVLQFSTMRSQVIWEHNSYTIKKAKQAGHEEDVRIKIIFDNKNSYL